MPSLVSHTKSAVTRGARPHSHPGGTRVVPSGAAGRGSVNLVVQLLRLVNVSVIAYRRQHFKHYSVSALLVLAATVLTLAIRPYFDGKAPLFFFTLAVLFAAGYGGAGPGFLATAFSFGIALLLFRDHIVVLVLAHSSLT